MMESVFLRNLGVPSADEVLGPMVVTCILLLVAICLGIGVCQQRGYVVGLTPRRGLPLPPGNDGLPFIGETLLLASQKDQFFRIRRSKFGCIFRTHLFGCPAVRVTGETNIKYLLQIEDRHLRSYYPTAVRRLIGLSALVTASGSAHRQKKRFLAQYLSREFLHHNIPKFSVAIRRHLCNWGSKDTVSIYPACKALTVDVALRFLLDLDPSLTQVEETRALLCDFTDNLFCFPLYLPGTSYYKSYNAKIKLMGILDDLQTSQKQGKSPLVLFTNTNSPVEALESLFELLFVGADNNGSGIFAIVNLLARHPEVVDKACRELEKAGLLGVSNESTGAGHVQWEQLAALPYIRAVVKESLRLLPPVGGFYRTVTEGFFINDYYVPKGWRVVAGIRETHENDLDLKDPLIFDPDRWLTGDAKPAFLTFGGGSRVCPGQQYADLLLRTFVVELVRRWRFEIVRDSEITMFPSVKPSGDMTVKFAPLDVELVSV